MSQKAYLQSLRILFQTDNTFLEGPSCSARVFCKKWIHLTQHIFLIRYELLNILLLIPFLQEVFSSSPNIYSLTGILFVIFWFGFLLCKNGFHLHQDIFLKGLYFVKFCFWFFFPKVFSSSPNIYSLKGIFFVIFCFWFLLCKKWFYLHPRYIP